MSQPFLSTSLQSLSWLLHNYFLPTISPQSDSSSLAPPLRPLKPILKQYKECMKIVSRDASLASKHKHELTAFMKDIERWLAEAAVAANISFGEVGWDSSAGSSNSQSPDSLSEQEFKERWALDRLCDELLEKGALVPLSKKCGKWVSFSEYLCVDVARQQPGKGFYPPNHSCLRVPRLPSGPRSFTSFNYNIMISPLFSPPASARNSSPLTRL